MLRTKLPAGAPPPPPLRWSFGGNKDAFIWPKSNDCPALCVVTHSLTKSLTHTSCRSTFLGWGKTLHICNKEGKGSVIKCSSQIFSNVSPSHSLDCECQFDQRLRYVCLLKNVNMLPRLILAHSSFYHNIIHYNLKCNFIWLLNWEVKSQRQM